jgi:HD-like signal output (HDOD) protein
MKTNQDLFLRAITRIEKFSPAPLILARAMKLLRDPDAEVSSIAELVGSDPALAADVIRCANSAYFSGDEPIQTVGEAVQKIGFRETIHLLNLAVGRLAAGRDLNGYGISADDYWSECLFNGLFARNLASTTGPVDPDEAYTVGLLRFVGRLAINDYVGEHRATVFKPGAESIAAWEIRTVGCVQSRASALLLAKWQFSTEMVQAISGQDDPAALSEQNWLAEVLHFASVLLPQGVGLPFAAGLETATPVPRDNDFMRRSGLTPATVETLLANTREDFDGIRHTMGGPA